MVVRSNRTIKLILKMVTDYVTYWEIWMWAVRMALNSTKHTPTGQTVYKLFMSHNEDLRFPVDLLCDTPGNFLPDWCESQYVNHQRLIEQEITEMMRQKMEWAAAMQMVSKERQGLNVRKYKRHDWMWSRKLSSLGKSHCKWLTWIEMTKSCYWYLVIGEVAGKSRNG